MKKNVPIIDYLIISDNPLVQPQWGGSIRPSLDPKNVSFLFNFTRIL